MTPEPPIDVPFKAEYAKYSSGSGPSIKTKNGGFFKSAKKGFNAFGRGASKTAKATGKATAAAYHTSAEAKAKYHKFRVLNLSRKQEREEYKTNRLNLKSQREQHRLAIIGARVGRLQQKKLLAEEKANSRIGLRATRTTTINRTRGGPLSDKNVKRTVKNQVTGKLRKKGGFFS